MRFVLPARTARAVQLALLAVCTVHLYGCKSSGLMTNPFDAEARALRRDQAFVDGFTDALGKADSERLASIATSSFHETALADESSIAEVNRIWPVQPPLKVVSTQSVSEDALHEAGVPEKILTVKDERGWKTDLRLVSDADGEHWKLDEILITQTKRGISATRTVSEQVVFVNVVQKFASAWRGSDREQRLAGLTADCRAELEPLPDEVLDHLAGKMFPPDVADGKPDAMLDVDIASVRLERPTSSVQLDMKRVDGTWLVDDATLTGKNDEGIPSLRKSAVAYAAAVEFLAAYNAGDRETLTDVATKSFFDATLKSADLSSIPLPPPEAARAAELKVEDPQGELIIDEGDRTVQLSLVRTNDLNNVNEGTRFRVQDVTLYENGGQIKKRLASALVAVPMAQLYADALVNREITQLRVMSTRNFIEQVWNHVASPEVAASLPLNEIEKGSREVLSVIHNGSATEVTMMQAGRAMTYVLHEEDGAVKVDDVLLAVADRPQSLKTTMIHVLPVVRLKTALAKGDVDAVRRHCSTDFNRLIWSQVRRVPPTATAAARFLDAPLASLQTSETAATAKFGSESYGGVVSLLERNGEWKINDVKIIAGSNVADQASLKPMLRDALANGTLFADAGPSGTPPVTADAAQQMQGGGSIQQVKFEAPAASSDSDASSAPASLPLTTLPGDAAAGNAAPRDGRSENAEADEAGSSGPKEPRPLDLGAAKQLVPADDASSASTTAAEPETILAPEAASMQSAPPADTSALPFAEPLW